MIILVEGVLAVLFLGCILGFFLVLFFIDDFL